MNATMQQLKGFIKKVPVLRRLLKSWVMAKRLEQFDEKEEIQFTPAEKKTLQLPSFSCLMDVESGMAGHQLFLFNLTREIKALEVLEIGLGMANSTLAFLLALQETGGRLTSIDITPLPEAVARIEAANLQDHWQLIQGASQNVRGHLPPGTRLDILFVDGNHSYQQCKTDYELYQPLVRDGGYIIFHDSATIAGVMKFANELKRRNVECVHFPYCNGIFVIHKQAW